MISNHMSTYIYSWNANSEGAAQLKDTMGIKKIKHTQSRFKGGPKKRVINWGSTRLPEEIMKCNVINHPDKIREVANKLDFFRKMGVNNEVLVPWTEDFDTAVRWISEGHVVVARTILNGHSGAGIVLMDHDNPNSWPRAPLYTKYVKKTEEYRIHIAFGEIIDFQRKTLSKRKAESGEDINWKIRNLDNGFIYQRGGVDPHPSILDAAKGAMTTCELDFGGVDIVWNQRANRPYVLEINTAPGITGTTVENYARALKERA